MEFLKFHAFKNFYFIVNEENKNFPHPWNRFALPYIFLIILLCESLIKNAWSIHVKIIVLVGYNLRQRYKTCGMPVLKAFPFPASEQHFKIYSDLLVTFAANHNDNG
jgi:hypothetical protein